MKILMIDALGVFGMAMYDLELCENLAAINGRDIILEVPQGYKYDSSLIDIRRSSRHLEKNLGKLYRTWEYIKWLKRITARARQWRPDIIHWQFGFFTFFDLQVTRHLKAMLPQARIVITLHDTEPARPTWNNVISRKSFFRSAHGVVAHSPEALNDYGQWLGTDSKCPLAKVIPHGPYASPLEDFSPEGIRRHFQLDSQGPVIISIGSINENKNLVGCLQIVAELQKLCPTVYFFIGGSSGGRDLNPLLKQRDQAPLPQNIVILNRFLTDEEVDQAHCLADFSLYIYDSSVTSGAALRSLCAGVPVICNNLSGFRSIVHDGWNGIMVAESDPVGAARKIYQVIQNSEALKTMKKNALSTYQGITWEKVAREHYNFYLELLGNPVSVAG